MNSEVNAATARSSLLKGLHNSIHGENLHDNNSYKIHVHTNFYLFIQISYLASNGSNSGFAWNFWIVVCLESMDAGELSFGPSFCISV